ncbi:MAG TPA: hypothetical protein VH325_15495 [Bryobacteraceae bacterium]|jgi:hypothetical protein|nr:hypothetical protein [Bryobacteraceae bacterium]
MKLRKIVPAFIALLVSAGPGRAGTISGNVADYNAADVLLTNNVLVVPANVATYTATSTITAGSSFIVTLPSGFEFGSVPALTTSGSSTFTLSTGGLGERSATFTVAAADLTSGQTISLAGFDINGASALQTVTPVASALPLTMQAIGSDASPLSFKAFASDLGAHSVFVGAIQFIDINPPSNGTKFIGPPDTLTIVLSAIEISAQTVDAATNTVPILNSNGSPNSLLSTDTATVTIGGNFGGIATAFSSSSSDCLHPLNYGTVKTGSISIPNVAINTEVFFCLTGSGQVLQSNPNGLTNITVGPGSSTDFLSSNNVQNEFPGEICYSAGSGCVSWTPPAIGTPALSDWAMIGLIAMMLSFGVWKLSTRQTT